MPPSAFRPELPIKLGVYELTRKIGSGAMGDVYEATHRTLGKRVALKVLRTDGMNEEMRLRFLQEGVAASRVRHPNVVEVTDAGTESDVAYLAMTLLEGESLSSHLKRVGRMSVPQAVDTILPLCAALAAAHEAGVLHRDLKPGNIFLAEVGRGDPEPVLLDFGISKLLDPVDTALTENPQFLGTPLYISPEQADGAPSTPASDQYSLALTLYECLLGVRPHERFKTSLVRLLRAVSEAEIPSPRSLDPGIPQELEDILLKALSRTPGERFESISEFGAVLLPFASATRASLWQHSFVDTERTMASVSNRVSSGPTPTRRVRVEVDETPTPPTASGSGSGQSWHSDPDGVGWSPEESAISRKADSELLPQEEPSAGLASRAASPRPNSDGPVHSEDTQPTHTKNSPTLDFQKSRGEPPARRPWPIYLLATALSASAVFAGVLILRPTDAPKSAVPTQYDVHIATDPPGAQLELDGRPVGSSEFHGSFARDGQSHELRAVLEGYQPRSVVFRDVPPGELLRLQATPGEERTSPPAAEGAPTEGPSANHAEPRSTPHPSKAHSGAAAPPASAASSPASGSEAVPSGTASPWSGAGANAVPSSSGNAETSRSSAPMGPGADADQSAPRASAGTSTPAPGGENSSKPPSAPPEGGQTRPTPSRPDIRTGNIDPWAD